MIYSKRHRLHGVKPIAWKVNHSLPMFPAQYLIPIQTPIEYEPERITQPTCAVKYINVQKLVSTIKRAMEEFDDQVKASAAKAS